MKKLMNFRKTGLLKIFGLAYISSLLLVSCLGDNNTEDNSALYEEQYLKMKADNYMTSKDSIGYKVYMKFLSDTTGSDSTRATKDNAVLISYEGYDYSGNLLSTTDAELAYDNKQYRKDVIYGPSRVIVKYAIGGIWLGLVNMPVNSEALLVIPSEMASGTGPVKFIIKLHRIVANSAIYEVQQREAYMNLIEFDNDSLKTAIDSSLWYKFIGAGNFSEFTYYTGSSVKIELNANYCEYEPGILETNPGRQFFKINNINDTLIYPFELTSDFPITPAIDTMVAILNASGYRQAEFITASDNAYGTSGYIHPYLGNYIVPPYMAVHYNLRLIDIKN